MNQTAYNPRNHRLPMPEKKRPSFVRKAIDWGMLGVAFFFISYGFYHSPLRRYYTKPPVIGRHELSNGDTLLVHAVLRNNTDSLNIRDSTVSGSFKFGRSLVVSCRNQQTGLPSDWTWLKHFEVEDKYGSTVQGQIVEAITLSSDGRTKSRGGIIDPAKLMDFSEVYFVVHFPDIETDTPCEYVALDLNDEVVAEITSPFPPSQTPEGYYDHSHNLIAKHGPWTVELTRITAMWHADQSVYQNSINLPEFHFEYEGNLLDKENVAQFESEFTDALGNPVGHCLQPNNQPLWKYRLKVARCDYPTSKQAKELKSLGRISHLSVSRELPISDERIQANSFLYNPVGKHTMVSQTPIENGESLFSSHSRTGMQRLIRSSCTGGMSGNGGIYESHCTAEFTLEHNEVLLELDLATKTGQPAKLEFDTKRPLVMLQLAEQLDECIVNVFAFDQFNRALQVDSVPTGMLRLPMFLVETESDTKHIDLYYSIEPIVPIEFYMVPPTKGLVILESGSTWFRMTGTQDGWQVDRQYYPNQK